MFGVLNGKWTDVHLMWLVGKVFERVGTVCRLSGCEQYHPERFFFCSDLELIWFKTWIKWRVKMCVLKLERVKSYETWQHYVPNDTFLDKLFSPNNQLFFFFLLVLFHPKNSTLFFWDGQFCHWKKTSVAKKKKKERRVFGIV